MFGVIVFVHEFGHFLFARLNHIRVVEFSIGMGPSIASWNRKDTMYSIRALPIGGYCMMAGMDSTAESEGEVEKDGFNSKSVLARLSVSFAGPLFNFILAFLLSIIICHYYAIDEPVLSGIMEDSAAAKAGMEVGDEITRIDGGRIYNYREITLYSLVNDPAKPVDITYKRDGKEYTTTLTRQKDPETGNYYFGFMSQGRMSDGILDEMKYSVYEVRFQIKTVIYSLKMMFTGKASKDDLMGPVGIGSTMNGIIEEAKEETAAAPKSFQLLTVFLNIVNFAVLISANLGVMNLLPIPALDGGRILFILIEGISGKRVAPEKEMVVTTIGVVLLMILMVFVFFNDLGNVLHK